MVAIKDQGETEHFNFFKSVFCGTHYAFAAFPNIWDLPTDIKNYPVNLLPTNPSAYLKFEFLL